MRLLGGPSALRDYCYENARSDDIRGMERGVRCLLDSGTLVRQELENHAALTVDGCGELCARKLDVDKTSRIYLRIGSAVQRRADDVLVSGDAQVGQQRCAVAPACANNTVRSGTWVTSLSALHPNCRIPMLQFVH